MIRVFGVNRRQKPLELRCPGGRIVITREPHGTVSVTLSAENGEVVLSERSPSPWCAKVLLRHEEREP